MRSLIFRRAAAVPLRRDPAPSRWAYRMQRLWLTPVFRRLARVGLPAFCVVFAAGLYLSDEGRRAGMTDTFASFRDQVKNRPEFMVGLLSVDGASPPLAEMVRTTLALPLPQSSLDLDLGAAHDRVAALPAVKSVHLRVQPGGVLQVTVEEREPAFVWRAPHGLILLDEAGHHIAGIDSRSARADLPVLAGEGADRAVAEAIDLLVAAGPFQPRLRGLVRMGGRRWDMVLDRNQRILLPAEDPLRALDALIALDQAQGVMARDILSVDLRLSARPALRLAPYALTEMRRASGILPAESEL
ncbi:MAG: cell division protein FtsQ/DivIB [Gemmobacter sp.]